MNFYLQSLGIIVTVVYSHVLVMLGKFLQEQRMILF